jgi:hypothetical protein
MYELVTESRVKVYLNCCVLKSQQSTERVSIAVTHLTRIRKVPGSYSEFLAISINPYSKIFV